MHRKLHSSLRRGPLRLRPTKYHPKPRSHPNPSRHNLRSPPLRSSHNTDPRRLPRRQIRPQKNHSPRMANLATNTHTVLTRHTLDPHATKHVPLRTLAQRTRNKRIHSHNHKNRRDDKSLHRHLRIILARIHILPINRSLHLTRNQHQHRLLSDITLLHSHSGNPIIPHQPTRKR